MIGTEPTLTRDVVLINFFTSPLIAGQGLLYLLISPHKHLLMPQHKRSIRSVSTGGNLQEYTRI
jgi:hypothetical protein